MLLLPANTEILMYFWANEIVLAGGVAGWAVQFIIYAELAVTESLMDRLVKLVLSPNWLSKINDEMLTRKAMPVAFAKKSIELLNSLPFLIIVDELYRWMPAYLLLYAVLFVRLF